MTATPLTTADLRRLVGELSAMAPARDDADGIERIRLFEELTAVCAAEQMREAVTFAASREFANEAAGQPRARRSRGVAAQLGLARRISPHQAQRWLGCARILIDELPATFAEVEAGRVTAWRAILVARETVFLSRAHRAEVDARLAQRLTSLGDRGVERAARTLACQLDPAGAADRARNAARDRHVSVRPAPDTMCRLGGLLPAAMGIAAYAALGVHADSLIGTGGQGRNADGTLRTRGQIMADTMVERITGAASAHDLPVEIDLVIGADALFAPSSEPCEPSATVDSEHEGTTPARGAAELVGYGPIPAPIARELALGPDDGRVDRSVDDGAPHATPSARWIRRLFTLPSTGELAAMDSHRRLFTDAQRRFVRLRDHDTCRTQWCDAPIRHIDHISPAGNDGRTKVSNGQGLCEACNYAKQAPGWRASPLPDAAIQIVVPTGQVYLSPAPDPLTMSPVERRLHEAITRRLARVA